MWDEDHSGKYGYYHEVLEEVKVERDLRMAIYIISNASVINGELNCERIMKAKTYEDAIQLAQDNIAEDFGYCSWNEYLNVMDPRITEDSKNYIIYDTSGVHEEIYRIERLVLAIE